MVTEYFMVASLPFKVEIYRQKVRYMWSWNREMVTVGMRQSARTRILHLWGEFAENTPKWTSQKLTLALFEPHFGVVDVLPGAAKKFEKRLLEILNDHRSYFLCKQKVGS